VFLFQAGGAIQPVEWFKFGATFLYYGVQEKLTQKLNFLNGDPALASLGLAGGTPSFGLAAEFSVPTVPLKIGIDYRHSGDLNLTGRVHFQNVPANFQSLLVDQGVSSAVTVPNELFVGAAYKVLPNLELMASWSLERWVVYHEDRFVGDRYPVGDPNHFEVVVPRDYKNAHVFRFGAEYSKVPLLPDLTLRCGLLRSISDQPLTTVSPSLTDGKSTGLSVGAGYQIQPNLRIDVGYQYVFFDNVSSDTSQGALPGTYATTVHLVSGGLTWRTDL
jgi:long-chain fatty acid transport protein